MTIPSNKTPMEIDVVTRSSAFQIDNGIITAAQTNILNIAPREYVKTILTHSITSKITYIIALMFFEGKDLDARGQANPDRAFFRLDKDENVESNDDPGEIYYEDLLDDIVEYIIDHMDDREFPEEIQDILTEYQIKG